MKIVRIDAFPLMYKLEAPINDAVYSNPSWNGCVVEVTTDEGLVGHGEAYPVGGPLESLYAMVKEVGDIVIGQDPMFTERIWERVYIQELKRGRRGIVISALSGIDVALWDIKGKAANLPAYKLLGGYRDRIALYASGGYYEGATGADALIDEVKAYIADGYRAVKIKIGGSSAREDLERVRLVREAIGPDVILMIDANGAYDSPTAIKVGRELDRLDCYFFEEPVNVDDIGGSVEVARALDLAVAGYEHEVTRYGFRELIERRAVDIVQPDVSWAGGFSECRKIADLAGAHHMLCIPHTFSSAVSLFANMHFVASIPNGRFLELSKCVNPLRDELVLEMPAVRNGEVFLPERPGLGVELNMETVNRYKAF